MVRERLRAQGARSWWDHTLAAGPELAMSVTALVLMPWYLYVSLPGPVDDPLDVVYFPRLTIISVFGLLGALTWLYAWVMEKCRGLGGAVQWDRFGALQQAVAWTAAGLTFLATPAGTWSSAVLTLAVGVCWVARWLATGRLLRRAEQAETLVSRAETALADTGEHPILRGDD